MEKKIPKTGLYLCDPGGEIGAVIDLQILADKSAKIKGVEHSEVAADPFSEDFLTSVREKIEADTIDRIVWAGRFTSRQQESLKKTLAGINLNPYLHEWCDIGLYGIGRNGDGAKVQQQKALSLIKMAAARARLLQPLEPHEIPAIDVAVVVGAGIAGLHVAASFLERGKPVHLVEQQSGVGGKVALLSRFYPLQCDPHCGLEYVLKSLRNSDKLTLHTLSKPTGIEGAAGNFSVTVQSEPRYVDESRCNGCGRCAEVCPVDLPVFTDSVQDEPPFQQEKGIGSIIRETRKAIHPSLPYAFPESYVVDRQVCPEGCSACRDICPTKAIDLDQVSSEQSLRAGAVVATTGWDPYPLSKMSTYFGYGVYPNVIGNLEMEQVLSRMSRGLGNPTAPPVKNLKTVGFVQCVGSRNKLHLSYCSSVCCSATIKQIQQLKSIQPDVTCIVFYQDMRCNGFEEDMYQALKEEDDILFVRGFPKITGSESDGSQLTAIAEDTFSGKPVKQDLDLLVLAGGMQLSQAGQDFAEVSGLPLNESNFLTGHYQCYPEESQRSGIVSGGCARGPMNVSQSIDSAHRAAFKALNFLDGSILIKPTFPLVDKTKCDECKRCVEECPFGVYHYDEKGFPEPDLGKCRQCGNCMGTCPVAAISLNNFTIKQLAAQIEVLENSFLDYEEPLILAFLCENDAYPAARAAVDSGLNPPLNAIYVKVPCAGAVNNAVVADALALGIDGVLIAGCKDGQCHYVNGNQLVLKRSGDLREKLTTMMIEPERVRSESIEIQEGARFVQILEDYIEDLKQLGPNPFKV